jgi:predicted alpha/beta hydrolase family esterase
MPDVLQSHDFLLLPCRDNASPDHWQSHWQTALPNMTRVEQDDWVSPKYASWAARLDSYVARAPRPVVLIAHSLGTSLIMHWAARGDTSRIAGASEQPVAALDPARRPRRCLPRHIEDVAPAHDRPAPPIRRAGGAQPATIDARNAASSARPVFRILSSLLLQVLPNR